MRGLDVVGMDFELGLGIGRSALLQEDRLEILRRIDLLRALRISIRPRKLPVERPHCTARTTWLEVLRGAWFTQVTNSWTLSPPPMVTPPKVKCAPAPSATSTSTRV